MMEFLPFMFPAASPFEQPTSLSVDAQQEVLAAHLQRIMTSSSRFAPGDVIIQPPGARVYSIGIPESPAVFVRYLPSNEYYVEDCNGIVDCLIAGVNTATVGVWPAASWRFVLYAGDETENATTKLGEFCTSRTGFIPMVDVLELFPSAAECMRWFLAHGWSRELRRLKKTPKVVFYSGDAEQRKIPVHVTIIDGMVEQVSGPDDAPEVARSLD